MSGSSPTRSPTPRRLSTPLTTPERSCCAKSAPSKTRAAAAAAGVDVVTAQGTEAGGHTGRISTLPLVPAVVDAVAPLPVIAAGGIADGRGIAAALMLGAEGVWIGTRFLGTRECGVSDAYKARVVAATGDDTVLTDLFDIAIGMPWPDGVSGRAIRNRFVERWARAARTNYELGDRTSRRVPHARPGDRDRTRRRDLGRRSRLVRHGHRVRGRRRTRPCRGAADVLRTRPSSLLR